MATDYPKSLNIGYAHFLSFRLCIATAYSEKHGKMYQDMILYYRNDILPRFKRGFLIPIFTNGYTCEYRLKTVL
jgi:hypothetical protein